MKNQRIFHTTEQLTQQHGPREKSLEVPLTVGIYLYISRYIPLGSEESRWQTNTAEGSRRNRWNRRIHQRPAAKPTKYSLFERQRDLLFSRSPALLRRLLRIFSVTRWQLQNCVRCCRDFRLRGNTNHNIRYANRSQTNLQYQNRKSDLATCRHRRLSAPRNTPTGPRPPDPVAPMWTSNTSRTWARSPAWR